MNKETMEQFENSLIAIKNSIEKKYSKNYLDEMDKIINEINNEKLGTSLLINVYQYYKTDMQGKVEKELNNLLSRFSQTFEYTNDMLTKNETKFMYPIMEFPYFGIIYYTIYSQNLTYEFIDSISSQQKQEMNYTIGYYYSVILRLVNKTYSYIMSNIPTNQYGFDYFIDKRTNEIKTKFNELETNLKKSKEDVIDGQKQLSYLKVANTNFFGVNNYVTNNINQINIKIVNLYKKTLEIASRVEKEKTPESIAMRFFLENSINGRQITECYESIDNSGFVDLKIDMFKDIINNYWIINQDDLIKNFNNSLYTTTTQRRNEFNELKETFIVKLENKINEYFTKGSIETNIKELYSKGLKSLPDESRNKIVKCIDIIINKIKEKITSESSRLKTTLTSYSNNFELIEKTLENYKKTYLINFIIQ